MKKAAGAAVTLAGVESARGATGTTPRVSRGTGMSAAFYEWLQGVPSCERARRSGAILTADFNFKEILRVAFTSALITEFGMPALDAASKDPALMTSA